MAELERSELKTNEGAHLRPACVDCTYQCNKLHADRRPEEEFDPDRIWPHFRKKMTKQALHDSPHSAINQSRNRMEMVKTGYGYGVEIGYGYGVVTIANRCKTPAKRFSAKAQQWKCHEEKGVGREVVTILDSDDEMPVGSCPLELSFGSAHVQNCRSSKIERLIEYIKEEGDCDAGQESDVAEDKNDYLDEERRASTNPLRRFTRIFDMMPRERIKNERASKDEFEKPGVNDKTEKLGSTSDQLCQAQICCDEEMDEVTHNAPKNILPSTMEVQKASSETQRTVENCINKMSKAIQSHTIPITRRHEVAADHETVDNKSDIPTSTSQVSFPTTFPTSNEGRISTLNCTAIDGKVTAVNGSRPQEKMQEVDGELSFEKLENINNIPVIDTLSEVQRDGVYPLKQGLISRDLAEKHHESLVEYELYLPKANDSELEECTSVSDTDKDCDSDFREQSTQSVGKEITSTSPSSVEEQEPVMKMTIKNKHIQQAMKNIVLRGNRDVIRDLDLEIAEKERTILRKKAAGIRRQHSCESMAKRKASRRTINKEFRDGHEGRENEGKKRFKCEVNSKGVPIGKFRPTLLHQLRGYSADLDFSVDDYDQHPKAAILAVKKRIDSNWEYFGGCGMIPEKVFNATLRLQLKTKRAAMKKRMVMGEPKPDWIRQDHWHHLSQLISEPTKRVQAEKLTLYRKFARSRGRRKETKDYEKQRLAAHLNGTQLRSEVDTEILVQKSSRKRRLPEASGVSRGVMSDGQNVRDHPSSYSQTSTVTDALCLRFDIQRIESRFDSEIEKLKGMLQTLLNSS